MLPTSDGMTPSMLLHLSPNECRHFNAVSVLHAVPWCVLCLQRPLKERYCSKFVIMIAAAL